MCYPLRELRRTRHRARYAVSAVLRVDAGARDEPNFVTGDRITLPNGQLLTKSDILFGEERRTTRLYSVWLYAYISIMTQVNMKLCAMRG